MQEQRLKIRSLFFLNSLILLFGFAAYTEELVLSGNKDFVKNWQISGQAQWKIQNQKHLYSLPATLIWNKNLRVKSILIQKENEQVPVNIKNSRAQFLMPYQTTELKVQLEDASEQSIRISLKPKSQSLLINEDCKKIGIDAKTQLNMNNTYPAGLYCELNKNKVLVIFSSLEDADINSSLFEIDGKGEAYRVYEFPVNNNIISLKGNLGNISWGKENTTSSLILVAGAAPGTKDQKSDPNADKFGYLNIEALVSSLSITSQNPNTSSEIGLFVQSDITQAFGSHKFGYLAHLNVLLYGMDSSSKINFSDIALGGIYWIGSVKNALGIFIAGKWISVSSGTINAGANAQAISAGLTFDTTWLGKNKLHIRASITPISQESTSGQNLDVQIQKDFSIKNHLLNFGIQYGHLTLETPPKTKLDEMNTGISIGAAF